MNADARRAYWVHYRSASDLIPDMKGRLTSLEGDLEAMRDAMHGEPSLVENGFPYIVNRLDELAAYAREIKAGVERKRQDGAEADARLDALIGAMAQ